MTEPLEPYVGARAVAALVDESVDTVQLWARLGKIPGTKLGKSWKFRLSEVTKALEPPTDSWAQSNQSRGRRRKAS